MLVRCERHSVRLPPRPLARPTSLNAPNAVTARSLDADAQRTNTQLPESLQKRQSG